jgi:hypothetical protein
LEDSTRRGKNDRRIGEKPTERKEENCEKLEAEIISLRKEL